MRPKSLGKTVEVKASNRPIKVAFLVPHQETVENHMVLDGVFHESYSRWAGAYTLIVPTNSKDFMHPEYGGWLEKFDPDFIYTYLEIEPSLVEIIDKLCSPIACLKHERRIEGHEDLRWRSFIPYWGLNFRGISSVTTISSPSVHPVHFLPRDSGLEEQEVTVATEYLLNKPPTRWLSDNFGTSFNAHNVTYPVRGFYKTLCLVHSDSAEHLPAGSERCSSMAEMLTAISTRKARPIARYAMAHSEAIWRVQSYPWSDCFNLFIGSTILDRLHFWNARHFTPNYAAYLGSLILESAFFEEPALVTSLGQYLNNNNFLGQNNGPAKVYLRSYSETEDKLREIADTLRKQTYNFVAVDKNFDAPSIPRNEDLRRDFIGSLADVTTFKVNEDSNTIVAKPPKHLDSVPARFHNLTEGQWITELEIQRHNSLSRSSTVDTWQLPRRHKIVHAFTSNLGKVTANHRLAVLATTKEFPYALPNALNQDCSYNLSLPDDGEFFRWLISPSYTLASNDLRTSLRKPCYEDIRISDKGQNLRGVISMFGHLSGAYRVLANKYWRHVLREGEAEQFVYDENKLKSYLPNDIPTREILMKSLHLPHIGKVTEYLQHNLTDTLECLIRLKIFFCVHQWRCDYCGHSNSRNFDSMKIHNNCEICDTQYAAPIDLEWKYRLNDFVYRSLITHTGLPVLWALGFLQDSSIFRGSFWYVPEVDLFEEHDAKDTKKKKEMDILCMHGGKFIAAEVKLSAIQLVQDPQLVDTFVQKINLIHPDIAMLCFEQYCGSAEEKQSVKSSFKDLLGTIRSRIHSSIELQSIVAEDTPRFNDPPVDLGYIGERTDGLD